MSISPPPRPYQFEGSAFLANRLAAILGDDAGLGKSRTTIMAMDLLRLTFRLIICPAVARLVWPVEIARWSIDPGHVMVFDPRTKTPPIPPPDHTYTSVTVIIAFDTISARRNRHILNELRSWPWDVIVIDEGHRLANPGSDRTQNIYGPRLDGEDGLIDSARRVWVLSGTLTPNHGGEAYTHARALFPTAVATPDGQRLLEYHEFIERYCTYKDTPYGRVITGTCNIAELRHRFDPYVLRRRKRDVLTELPPLNFVSVPVPGLQVPSGLAHLVPGNLDDDELLHFLRTHTEHLATLRRRLAEAKFAACVDYIVDLLESGVRKLVVFAHHVAVVTELREQLLAYSPVRIAGDTNDQDRKRAINLFQTDPETRVLVGQINACSVAITLTAASDVVFVEYSWVPGDNYQAASRCHRLGQRDGVLARMLYVPDSLDETILAVIARKTHEIAALWD